MPSLVQGYEYDIFISYRHNDNLDGWVSDFVFNLEKELKGTIKNSLTIYFDKNANDGLLETHQVDRSLETKLRCAILIPIISQTYCDVRSFAWQHEFCAFCSSSKSDSHGRYVRLANGNVACRILPIKIHEIDDEDTEILEHELDGALRAIEFIYREPGVNRPLKVSDSRNDNLSRTDYRNQINKVAIAIKEIIWAIIKPNTNAPAKQNRFESEVVDQRPSLAVLPFSNLSRDTELDYFSDGIAENIISELASHRAFRIISRTSVMRYKKSTQSASEIASELKVKYILEGGVQVSGNKMRINIQLANAEQDDILWSKIFHESIEDIFTVQSKVSEAVVSHLHESFEPASKTSGEKHPTQNPQAYNFFLKGRHAFNQWNVEGYRSATTFFEKALAIDPDFAEAYSSLASCYSARMSWNGDLSPVEAVGLIEKYLAEAWKRGPSANDYITKAFIAFFVEKNFAAAEKLLLHVISLNPNEATALYTYSYVLNMMGRHEEAKACVSHAALIDPLTVAFFNYSIISDYLLKNYASALATLDEAIRLYPLALRLYDHKARLYLTLQNWEEAEKTLMAALQRTPLRPPSIVAFLSIASYALKKTEFAESLLAELERRSSAEEKGVNIYLVHIYNFLGDHNRAQQSLDRARKTNDIDLIWFDIDPLLSNFREASRMPQNGSTSPFEKAEQYISAMLEEKMPALPYHNLGHIKDVLAASVEIATHERVSDEELGLLRLAALLHDAGFIDTRDHHEERGAAIAREILPAFGFSAAQINIIEQVILSTRVPQTPTTKLEKILCDADLDYLGRDDFYKIGDRLQTEMSDRGLINDEREWNQLQHKFLKAHQYHTNYSKERRELAKQKRLDEISLRLENAGEALS